MKLFLPGGGLWMFIWPLDIRMNIYRIAYRDYYSHFGRWGLTSTHRNRNILFHLRDRGARQSSTIIMVCIFSINDCFSPPPATADVLLVRKMPWKQYIPKHPVFFGNWMTQSRLMAKGAVCLVLIWLILKRGSKHYSSCQKRPYFLHLQFQVSYPILSFWDGAYSTRAHNPFHLLIPRTVREIAKNTICTIRHSLQFEWGI